MFAFRLTIHDSLSVFVGLTLEWLVASSIHGSYVLHNISMYITDI